MKLYTIPALRYHMKRAVEAQPPRPATCCCHDPLRLGWWARLWRWVRG